MELLEFLSGLQHETEPDTEVYAKTGGYPQGISGAILEVKFTPGDTKDRIQKVILIADDSHV